VIGVVTTAPVALIGIVAVSATPVVKPLMVHDLGTVAEILISCWADCALASVANTAPHNNSKATLNPECIIGANPLSERTLDGQPSVAHKKIGGDYREAKSICVRSNTSHCNG
jgi:hypothetical protein